MNALIPQQAHSRLAPSSAFAWMNCPGYPQAVAGLPDEETKLAAEGTAAHVISDHCLTFGMDPHDFIGLTRRVGQWEFEWTAEDADLMLPGIRLIRDLGGTFYGEHRVDISQWLGPNQSGTLDRAVLLDDLIVIGDLKWGRYIPVSPVANKQVGLYALGFWWNIARHVTDATEFLFILDQPRNSAGGGEWRVSLDELLEFGEQARIAAQATLQPNAPLIATAEGCAWCARREAPGGCRAFDALNLTLPAMQYDTLDELLRAGQSPQLGRELTPERRAYILRHAPLFRAWLDELEADSVADAMAGRPNGGLKAIEGKANPRRWEDKDAADIALAPKLGEKRHAPPKLKTPTQLEKEIGKAAYADFVAPLVTRTPSKPVLVDQSDARPALLTAEAKFDEEGS